MNIAVAQSGGPTCAINASLVGVFRQALKTPEIDAVFGSINGIEGIINDELIDLKLIIKSNEDMELLRQTPSTVLGSCRYKLPASEKDSAVYEKIMCCFEKHRIEAFFLYRRKRFYGYRYEAFRTSQSCRLLRKSYWHS